MLVEMNKEGVITISAETPIESYALTQLTLNFQKPEDLWKKILIKTAID